MPASAQTGQQPPEVGGGDLPACENKLEMSSKMKSQILLIKRLKGFTIWLSALLEGGIMARVWGDAGDNITSWPRLGNTSFEEDFLSCRSLKISSHPFTTYLSS